MQESDMAALVSHATTFTRYTCKITRPAGARRRQVSPAVHRCAVQSASGGQRRAFVRACVRACLACVHACVRACSVPCVHEKTYSPPPSVSFARVAGVPFRSVSFAEDARGETFPARKFTGKRKSAARRRVCVGALCE